jgi:hypothetical protein
MTCSVSLGLLAFTNKPGFPPASRAGEVVTLMMKMSRSCLVGAAVLFGTLASGPCLQAAELTNKQIEERVSEAIRSLDKMTELWELGQYDDLYALGTKAFRASMTPEQFSFLMLNATRNPQCCFTRFQKAEGRLIDPTQVEVSVTIAYQYTKYAVSRPPYAPILPEHERETFVLVREAGRWRLDLNEVVDRAWISGRPY